MGLSIHFAFSYRGQIMLTKCRKPLPVLDSLAHTAGHAYRCNRLVILAHHWAVAPNMCCAVASCFAFIRLKVFQCIPFGFAPSGSAIPAPQPKRTRILSAFR